MFPYLLRWREHRCNGNIVRCGHDIVVAIIEDIFSMIVVPVHAIVVVINRNVCPVDLENLAEQPLLGDLVD